MKKEPLEQIVEWLRDGKIYFAEIAIVYVHILEEEKCDNVDLIGDLVTVATMYRDSKTNMGTKQDLEIKYKTSVLKSGLFAGTPFEKELESIK